MFWRDAVAEDTPPKRINKDRQASNYNKGTKDRAELKSRDTVRLIPPCRLANEVVKARVDKPVLLGLSTK